MSSVSSSARALTVVVAAAAVTASSLAPAVAATGTQAVVVDGTILHLVGDATQGPVGTSVPTLVVVDLGGTLVHVPPAEQADLARGQAVAVTLTGPAAWEARDVVAAAGLADPAVAVATVAPAGPVPDRPAVPDPDGEHHVRVLLGYDGRDYARPDDYLRGMTWTEGLWEGASGGALTVTSEVSEPRVLPGQESSTTCDPVELYNRVRSVHGADPHSGPGDHVVVSMGWLRDCPWSSYAALDGSVGMLNTFANEEAAHVLGHNFGLGHTDGTSNDVMAAKPGWVHYRVVNHAVAATLGWTASEDVPGDAETERVLAGILRNAPSEGLRLAGSEVYVQARQDELEVVQPVVTDGVLSTTVVRIPAFSAVAVPAVGLAVSNPFGGTGSTMRARLVPLAGDEPPAAPVVTGPAPGAVLLETGVRVSWETSAHEGIVGYSVLVDGVQEALVDGTRTSASVALPPGEVEIVVVAVDDAAHRTSSTPVVVTSAHHEAVLTLDWPLSGLHSPFPIPMRWQLGPRLVDAVAAWRVTVDGEVVRILPPAARSLDLPMLPGTYTVGLAAVAFDGSVLREREVGWVTVVEPAWQLHSDVPTDHPFYEDVVWAAQRGITTGYPDGTYRPTGPITREAIAAFLFRQAQVEVDYVAPATPPFSDVAPGHPFFREISWLREEGLATGYADGAFGGGRPMTRGAMAAFLHRLAGDPAAGAPSTAFSDVAPDHPFAAEIGWLATSGITTGYDDGTFRPGAPVSRGAMAAFLHRFVVGEASAD